MRILFAGTPEIAVPSLRALAGSDHEVVGVLTAPDRPKGRGRTLISSPVKELALELELPVLEPERLNAEARRQVALLGAEVLACFAYGKIFGPRFLELFPRGGLNVHPSLLPRHRGPAPIPGAILAGDIETGVTVQELALEMDAGDIVAQESIPLTGTETTTSLSEVVAPLGGRLLVDVLDRLQDRRVERRPQNHEEATFTRLVRKEDGEIDWSRSAGEIDRVVRACTPWPHAFTSFRGDRLVVLEAVPVSESDRGADADPATASGADAPGIVPGRVLRVDTSIGILVETGNGHVALQRLQLQSRKPLDWRSFHNGVQGFVGAVLGGS